MGGDDCISSGLSKYTDENEEERLKREEIAEYKANESSLPESQRGRYSDMIK